jgi:putative transposase
MNEKNPHEIQYRRQAFKLFEKGKSVAHILKLIPRSRSWLFKWKERFERSGWQALDSLPRAPVNSPQEHPEETIELVLRIRERLEKSEIGLIGPHEIREEIKRNRLMESPPSLASIKRWLKQAGYTATVEAPTVSAYYPTFQATDDLAIFSCDWIARYITGGEKVFAFHTINLQTHGLAQTLGRDKSAPSAFAHLMEAFSVLGLPDFLQIDNDAAFTGLGRSKPVFGRVIRLLLYLGIEVIFIPPGEPKRNGVVERVNGLWARAFWDKNHFSAFREVQRKSPKFPAWYQNHKPPSLDGMTVQEASGGQRLTKLRPRQIQQLPEPEDLPLTAGRLHFIRKVDESGEIDILKEHWRVSKTLAGKYVWATIDLSKKELLIYGRRSLRAKARLIKQFAYEIKEPMRSLLPEYKRRARKVNILQRI